MKTGYQATFEWKNHPAGLTHAAAHFKNLADTRRFLREAFSEDAIKPGSVSVYHGWDASKVNVTDWAMQTFVK